MFLCLKLREPELCDARGAALEAAMREHKVAVLTGDVCAVPCRETAAAPGDGGRGGGDEAAYLRLTFVLPEDEYDEAARRLRAMLLSLRRPAARASS